MENYEEQLAYARAKTRESTEVLDEAGRVVKPPSKLKYGFLLSLAIIGDALDYAQLTGIGLILTWAAKIVIFPILFMAGHGASKRVKAMNDFHRKVEGAITEIAQKIRFYSRLYRDLLLVVRKIPSLKKYSRGTILRFARVRKIVLRSPFIKTTLGLAADLLPLIDLLPWRTIVIYLAYRDEKRTYLEVREILPQYMEAKDEESVIEEEISFVEEDLLPEPEPEQEQYYAAA